MLDSNLFEVVTDYYLRVKADILHLFRSHQTINGFLVKDLSKAILGNAPYKQNIFHFFLHDSVNGIAISSTKERCQQSPLQSPFDLSFMDSLSL